METSPILNHIRRFATLKMAAITNICAPVIGKPKCIWACGTDLAEGPLWLPDLQELVFVDIMGKAILRYSPQGTRTVKATPGHPTAILKRVNKPGFVVTMNGGLHYFGEDLEYIEPIVDLPIDSSLFRTNDAKCDPFGRLWTGSMCHNGRQADGKLFIVSPDGSVDEIGGGYKIPNGPAFNAPFTRAYFADSPTRTIFQMSISKSGQPGPPTKFAKLPEALGYPDGMTVDREGCLWVACHGGSAVVRLDQTGKTIQHIKLPVRNVTSLSFGGPSLDQLFITTASDSTKASSPYSGGLFQIKVAAQGGAACTFG